MSQSQHSQSTSNQTNEFQTAQEVCKVFAIPFDPSNLEEKINEVEQVACCILKKVENLTTKKMKLVCAKQKCPYAIRLEINEGKYKFKDLQGEHNHEVSKDKFEEKLLTGKLLQHSDFIFQTYFINESEYCSKPKLILKDLKNRHKLDLLAGNYSPSQKQKLKKKFDNIVQQLRLKKQKSVGQNVSNNSFSIEPIQLKKKSSTNVRESFSSREGASALSTSYGDLTYKQIKSSPFLTAGCLASGNEKQQQNQKLLNENFQNKNQNFSSQLPLITPLQLSLMQQQQFYLMQQHQQQQQLLLLNGQQQQNKAQSQQPIQNGVPRVISEDSRSASFCKIEEQSESSEPHIPHQITQSSQMVINPSKVQGALKHSSSSESNCMTLPVLYSAPSLPSPQIPTPLISTTPFPTYPEDLSNNLQQSMQQLLQQQLVTQQLSQIQQQQKQVYSVNSQIPPFMGIQFQAQPVSSPMFQFQQHFYQPLQQQQQIQAQISSLQQIFLQNSHSQFIPTSSSSSLISGNPYNQNISQNSMNIQMFPSLISMDSYQKV